MQLRQTAGLAVPLVMASVLLAACSSSGSSSSSGSTATSGATSSSSAAGGLKTGDLAGMRALIRSTQPLRSFTPTRDAGARAWAAAAARI